LNNVQDRVSENHLKQDFDTFEFSAALT